MTTESTPLAGECTFSYNIRMLRFILVLCATFCLAGCLSLEATKSDVSGEEHVWIRNQCWLLFNAIPLCSGNAKEPDCRYAPFVFFRDDAQMDKVQIRMFNYARKQQRSAQDLVYHNYDTVMMHIPLLGIPMPIPYVICYHEIQLSGVMK